MARGIRNALDATFERLAPVLRGRRTFVTLSGGLDSTSIAASAHRWFEDVTAATFHLNDDTKREDPDGDLASARRVADELGIPPELVGVDREELITFLDPVFTWGQGWLDLNVHCALANAAIGSALRDRFPCGEIASNSTGFHHARPATLTGDTMNELLAECRPESYCGRESYARPLPSAGRLCRLLVDGLDAGDREVGIFAHHGIDTLQPYALCANAYAALPGSYLESEQRKQNLVRAVMGDEIPAHVHDRPKLRARVGGASGVSGTLAVVVDGGFDSRRLARRFAERLKATDSDIESLIRAGIYRFSAQYPGGSWR